MPALDYAQVLNRLLTLGPGQRVTYYIGFLDSECIERPRGEASQVAKEALKLSTLGRVHLIQRRLGAPICRSVVDWKLGHGPGFEYIAVGAKGGNHGDD